MADLSKLELTDSTLVTIKDNSQANSDHRHYEKDIVPLLHKTYESTSYYATATSWEASSWFFASVIPDSWYLPWKIKLKVHTYCPNYPTFESITDVMFTGRSYGFSYANWNELQTAAHYYTVWYPLTQKGFEAGYGHAIGISIYGASNYTDSSYYRTFEVDFLECENCTVTFLDTPVLWANWSGNTSTNYGSRANANAYSRGLQETGDVDTTTHNRISYFGGTTGTRGIWAASLFMEDADGTYQNICTAADGTVTTGNRTTATTKKANTAGFKLLSPIWYSNTAYNANTQIAGSGVIYSSYGTPDARYAFNVTLSTTALVPYSQLYLVGTIHSDGLFYLDDTWWSQTPNDTSKIYVLVGAVYDSTTSNVRYILYEQNKWYRYDGTNLIEIADEAISVNGHTVEADVPNNAVFTDTTYTFAGGTNKITVTPSGGSASDINITVEDTTKLPLAGGTLTGDVFATRGTASQRKLGFINDNDKFGGLKLNNNGNNIDFGWDYDQVAGAGAYFRAATYGSGTGTGQFGFFARSSNGTKQLVGSTNGILTWDGRRVVTSTNSTQIGSATKPVYVNNAGNVVECTNTLGASVPNNAVFTDANVTQSITSTDANYEVLFSGTADNTTRTEGVRKNNNLTFNPNKGELNATRFTGLTKEEYLEWGGRNITSNISPIGAALSADHSANRFNYLNPAAMTFEYSSDGGTTWTNYALTDGAKTAFVTDSMSYRINIGRPDDTTDVTTQSRSRITFTCQNGTTGYVYTNPKKLLINVSTAKPLSVLIETRTGTNYLNDGAWVTFGTYTLSGQSGWNDIPLILGTLGGGTGQTGNNWQLRLTVSVPEVSASYPKVADIRGIRLFGENTWYMANNLAKTGHVYAIDTVQNATFPANVQIKANKQVAYLSTTPTSGQVVVTDGASGGIKTTGYTIAKSVPSDAVFTDTMVTQTLTSTDANYPILFAKTTISTTTVDNINTARRNNSIYVNPSTGNLQVTQLNGVTVGDSPVFTDAKVTQNPLADNIKPLLLANSVSSSATTGQVYKQTNFTVDGYTNSLNLNAVSDAPAELNIQGNINIDAVDGLSMLYAPNTTATFSDVSAETINGEAIGTVISKDVPVSGNASTTQVVMGNDTRLTDARTPSSHTHGNIVNGGTISSTAVTPASTDYILLSDTSNSGKIERGIAIGTDTTKYLRNDGTWEVPSGGSGGSVGQIYYCETDSTSTTTAFVVNVTGVAALTDGLIICVKNITGASASGCTLNLNGLGAKGIWLSEANAACTTEWKNNSAFLFVYDATNERWVMQTGRDTDVTGNNIIARYSKVVSGGNNVKKYSLFALLPDGTYSSFTTNSGSGAKTFDSTNRFDIRKIYAYGGSSDRSTGDLLSASGWKMQGYDIDMRYSFNGVTTKASTSSLTAEQPVYLVFDPTTENSGCYKLKSPYYTQTPNATGAIYVLVGVMRDSYRLDFWFYNPAFTYDGTKLVPFSNATFAGLTDTYISNPAPCDVLMFDGSDWVNTNNIVLKDTNLHTTVSLNGDTGTITSANTPSTGGFTVNDVVVAGFTTGSGNYFKFSLPFANSATSASIISIDQTSAGTKVMLPNSTLQTNFIDVSNSSITSITKDWITFEFKFTSTQAANTPCTVVLVNLAFELF